VPSGLQNTGVKIPPVPVSPTAPLGFLVRQGPREHSHRQFIEIDRPPRVLLDQLDDSGDGSKDARELVVGLLKAAKDLGALLPTTSSGVGKKVIVFLRSDIYSRLRFDDKDKHRSSSNC
jgi:hypothetical protein